MTKITNRRASAFGIVSDALLFDKRLSVTSRLVGAYIEGRPDGFEIWAWYLQEALGVTKGLWQKSRKQLMKYGYLTAVRSKVRGKFKGYSYDFQVPTGAGFSGPGETSPGTAGPGKSGPITKRVVPRGVKQKKPQQTSENDMVKVVGVVVNEIKQGEGEAVANETAEVREKSDPLHWPEQLRLADRKACAAHLTGLEAKQKQNLIDELAGCLQTERGIANPVGWMRCMVSKCRAGALTLERAAEISELRAAKARAAARASLSVLLVPKPEQQSAQRRVSVGVLEMRQRVKS
jgi:hypothetical protein